MNEDLPFPIYEEMSNALNEVILVMEAQRTKKRNVSAFELKELENQVRRALHTGMEWRKTQGSQ